MLATSRLFVAMLVAALLLGIPAAASAVSAQAPTWVRGYPSQGNSEFGMTPGCVHYVAQWSDGTYTAVPWDCEPGVVARRDGLTSSRGYPQLAENGCVEYVTQWSDGSYTWVPFSCPPGVTYYKPNLPPPTPTTPVVESVNIYFTAPNGSVGCDDQVVAVERQIPATTAPLTAALEELLSVDEQWIGQSGLYSALAQSDLQIEHVSVANGVATIRLTGNFQIGGVCDAPRVEAQLRETALQFDTVDDVNITINGTPLDQLLSGR